MAKIITVQLLLASDSEIEIESFAKNELDQLIAATKGKIIDGKVVGGSAEPSPAVLDALRTGNYTQGKAFDHENGSARRLLIMDGDVSPYIIGPFDSEDLRLEAARVHRAVNGDRDGIYMLDVPRGIDPFVDAFSGADLEGGADPLTAFVIGELTAGRTPITRFALDGAPYWLFYQGDEVLVNNTMLASIEKGLGTELVRVDSTMQSAFMTRVQAKSSFTEKDWAKARKKGTTTEMFEAWAETMASNLPTAKDVLSGIVE